MTGVQTCALPISDLEKDPNELINCYSDPKYKKVVSLLKSKIKEYGLQFNDARINNPKIKSELQN